MLPLALTTLSAFVAPPEARASLACSPRGGRSPLISAQWGGFKVQKSDRLLIREAWERADAYRPGKPNWFTQKPKELAELHEELLPTIEQMEPKDPPGIPGAGNKTSLLGALLKSLSTGDLALTLCSKEPPVLKELRDWLVEVLPMEIAVLGLPEEQVSWGGEGVAKGRRRGSTGKGGGGKDAEEGREGKHILGNTG